MNRSNPFRFDLRNGIRFIAKKFLVLPLLVSLVCFEFMLRLRETASLNHQYAGAQPTLGDFAMYLFGGMKPYIPNPDEPFLFPVSWFLVFGICLFLTLYYPVYDRDTLILNYAFCIRSNEILVDGFPFPSGIVYALALSLLCMFIGRHRFRNFDLY